MQAMTCLEDMPAPERKRQREALRRRMGQGGPHIRCYKDFWVQIANRAAGLRPGLLQKYHAAVSPQQRFEFLRAFILDPQGLSDISIEASYVQESEKSDTSSWVEMPLERLRDIYKSPAEKKFLEECIVNVQPGRNHPQDPTGSNEDMRLYWVFQEVRDNTKNSNKVGTALRATGSVPANAAARTAVSDGLLTGAAMFSGGKGGVSSGGKGDGKTNAVAKSKAKAKAKGKAKAVLTSCVCECFYMCVYTFIFCVLFSQRYMCVYTYIAEIII